MIAIIRKKDDLYNYYVKARYGFLYNGYRESSAKYWEFVIIYRKLMLIIIKTIINFI